MKTTKRADSSTASPAAASEPHEMIVIARGAAVSLVEQSHALQRVRAADLPSLWAEHIAAVQELVHFLDHDGAPAPDSRRGPHMSMQQRREFGRLLRDRRNASGLSRQQLAHKALISDATIKFIETAHHPPSRASLIRLINVPGLGLRWADVPGHHSSLHATAGNPMGVDQGVATAGDCLMMIERMDFDELGDPVFVRRLVGSASDQFGPLSCDLKFVPLRR